MRKMVLFLTTLCLVTQISFAKQWIVFYADLGQVDHPLQNDRSKGGHAFVSFVKEDAVQKQTLVECWGFNPKKPDEIGWITYVEGNIKNDIARQREIGFMIEVTEAEFQACLKTKDLWVNTKYSVTMRNCVDFVRDIVNTLNEARANDNSRLKQPRGLYVLPSEYIRTLKVLNSGLEYKYPMAKTGSSENTNQPKNNSAELSADDLKRENEEANRKAMERYEQSRREANMPPPDKKVFSGSPTPSDLGRKIITAIQTNNKTLWYNCILKDDKATCDAALDQIRKCLMSKGVENWNLLSFSRVTFVDDTKKGGNLGFFKVEFTYGKDFVGVIGGGNYSLEYKNQYMLHHRFSSCYMDRK